ncbi:MAG: hypothetical protein H0U73_04315 [Tatlockia sp.]|nr:hypothetical protein [Tatlockia sp.]
MKTTTALSLLFSLGIASQSYAGFNALTHHSRANCAGFNESVTWWWNHPVSSRVESYHYNFGRINPNDNTHHYILTSKTSSTRHAAYHATESYYGDYSVTGYHYMYVNGQERCVQITGTTNCSQYDGWWD